MSKRRWPPQLGLALALAALMIGLALVRPNFITLGNLINLVRQISINGILAVGVTYVLLTGGVDLSLGSLVALTGVTAASLAHPGDYPAIVPVLAGIAAGSFASGRSRGSMWLWRSRSRPDGLSRSATNASAARWFGAARGIVSPYRIGSPLTVRRLPGVFPATSTVAVAYRAARSGSPRSTSGGSASAVRPASSATDRYSQA